MCLIKSSLNSFRFSAAFFSIKLLSNLENNIKDENGYSIREILSDNIFRSISPVYSFGLPGVSASYSFSISLLAKPIFFKTFLNSTKFVVSAAPKRFRMFAIPRDLRILRSLSTIRPIEASVGSL